MNLRRDFLAASITALLCFSQNVLAEDIVSTVTLNGVVRTLTFKNQDDANNMISNPTGKQTDLFRTEANGSPTTSVGLVSQSDLNGVPVNMVKVSGAQAVIGQPNATGGTDFITLTTTTPDGKPVTGADGKATNLTNLIQGYAAVAAGTATPEQTALLNKGAFAGVNDKAATALKKAVADASAAEVAAPVDVAVGGAPTPDASDAALVKARIQHQLNVDALKNSGADQATATGLTATVLPDLQAISKSTLVQLSTASLKQTSTATAAAAIAADTTLSDTAKLLAKVEVVSSIEATATAASNRANDATAPLADKLAAASIANDTTTALTTAVTAVENDPNASATQVAAAQVAKVNALADVINTQKGVAADPNATLAQKQAATDSLKTLVTQQVEAVNLVAANPNATADQIAAATKANKDAAQAEVDAQTAVVAAITDPTAKAEAQKLLDEANIKLTQATELATADPAVVPVKAAINVLNNANSTANSKANALATLKTQVANAEKDPTNATNAKILTEVGALKATIDAAIANDTIMAAQLAKLDNGTAAEKAAALTVLRDKVKTARDTIASTTATDIEKVAAQALLDSITTTQLAEIDKPVPPVEVAVTDAVAVLKGDATGNKEKAVKTLKDAYNKAKVEKDSVDANVKTAAEATLTAIGGEIAKYELGKAVVKFNAGEQKLVNTKTANQVFSARKDLTSAKASANESVTYKDLSTATSAAGVTAKAIDKTTATADTVLAQANMQLANTKTAEYYAQNTAANGIAGNPSSMMGLSVDHMFSQGSDLNGMTTVASGTTASGMQHSMGVGIQYNYFNLAGTSVNTVTLPLSYSMKLNSKSQVILSVPLSYIGQNKNDTYQVGAGVAFKYNVTDNWTLTPAFNYSHRTADSTELGYGAFEKRRALGDGVSMMGGGLTSKYAWNCGDLKISLTNMGSYFAVADGFGSTPVNAVGYSNDLGNFVMKNGISIGKSLNGFAMTTYFNDVEYFGSKLYFDQYNEFGFALKPENMGMLNAFSVGANYLFSFNEGRKGDLDGFKVNLNYQF